MGNHQVITRAQRKAIHSLYLRNPDNATTYREFRRRACNVPYIGCAGMTWCGMFIGIEKDGYTHS